MHVSNLGKYSDQMITDYTGKPVSLKSPETDNSTPKPQKIPSDYVFLNQIRPEQAREFLLSRIGQSITDVVPQAKPALPGFSQSLPDAKSTSSQIIDNVGQAASSIDQNNSATGKTLKDLVESIQKGFKQAKESLANLNVLSQGFDTEFNSIESSVNRFLDQLQSPQTTEISASAESYQTSSQASIQIETRDGDIVTIDLSNSTSQQQQSASLQTNDYSGYIYGASSESSNSLTFSVSGELDEGELNAISNLVGDIAKTVGQFEKGNVNAALEMSKKIDSQSEELSGFSFNVKTSEQYRAIDLYQKTQTEAVEPNTLDDNTQVTNTPVASNVSASVESIFSNNISSLIYAADNANINKPIDSINQIFNKIYEQLGLMNSDEPESENNQAEEQREVED